ncbi:fimbrial protein [Parabacteroides goldsteinii]|uniref:fimbrial protein n=1 Tax=Parabacteroides goldsteinii TaxID=328812 RepID=UPI0034A13460
MKMRNVISGIGLIVVGLFSCTSEEEIGPERSNSSLSVVLSVGDIETTKTRTAADGYDIATADEIKINDFYVAIFEENGTKIDDKVISTVSSEGVTSVTVNNLPGYQVFFKDIPAKYGKVFALIVANAESVYSTFEGYTQYNQYKSGNVISTLSGDFVVDKLAKSGISKVVSIGTTLEVGLTQLSARIDFGTVKPVTKAVNGGNVEESDFSVLTIMPGSTIEALLKSEVDKLSLSGSWEPINSEKILDKGDWIKYYSSYEKISDVSNGYYYEKTFGEYQKESWSVYTRKAFYSKRLNLVRKKVTNVSTTTQQPIEGTDGSFDISSISCSGINGKTDAILDSWNSQYKGIELPSLSENTSFYTYEYPEEKNDLTLTITGIHTWGGTDDTPVSKTSKWVYGIWNQDRGDGWSVPGAINEATEGITWFDGKGGHAEISEDISSLKSTEKKSLKSGVTSVYVVKWTDVRDTNGNSVPLQHGYRYNLSVKVIQNQFKVIANKLPWSAVTLDPTYDSSK